MMLIATHNGAGLWVCILIDLFVVNPQLLACLREAEWFWCFQNHPKLASYSRPVKEPRPYTLARRVLKRNRQLGGAIWDHPIIEIADKEAIQSYPSVDGYSQPGL